jgi:NAD(P)-dependent dehydrogenase (short-subunit alcohol dehydrogenase family)
MNVEGKVAVVTAPALASAKALAQAGASIVAIDLDASRFARLQEAVPEARLLVQAASVADEAAVAQALDAAVARFGAIHIVVNCAGVDADLLCRRGQPFRWRPGTR